MRGRLTLAQLFALFLLLATALLAAFLGVVFQASRRSLMARAAEVRDRAARQVADTIDTYLTGGAAVVEAVERQARAGSCDMSTADGAERCVVALMIEHPEATEMAITHATRLDFEDDGAPRLDPDDHWRVSVFRESAGKQAPALCIRTTVRKGSAYLNHTRCVSAGSSPDRPEEAGREEPSMDPTAWTGFTTPASGFERGQTLTSDLSYLEIDSALPEDDRRIGFHILRAIESEQGALLGVVRLSLLSDQIDERVSKIRVDEAASEGDPHRVFISDEQGRLITRTCPSDRMAVQGDDLRVAVSKPDPVLDAALARPELKAVDDDPPAQSARLVVGGEAFDVTYRRLPGTQDWRVGVLAPEDYYLADARRQLLQFGILSGGLVLLVVVGGSLTLRAVGKGLQRVDGVVDRLRHFDFGAQDPRSGFRDISEVLEALEQAKTALRGLGKYAPVSLVRQLYELKQEPVLGGELRDVSVLFTDIQGFTELSERLAPDELARRLGRYLEVMTSTLRAHQGTVDKFIGDAVMVLWNAPRPIDDHAALACRAALACVEATQALFARPDWEGPPLVTRFGIHVDRVMVGHFGSPDRLSYTALGDGVNLASRLEALNKQYGTTILVSDAVRERAKSQFAFRRVDRVAVKGRRQGADVYELLGPLVGGVHATAAAYESAFDAYLGRDFDRASSLLASQLTDGPSRVLHARCQELMERPPASSWDGTHEAKTK